MRIDILKRLITVAGIFALAAVVTGCASDNFRSVYDPSADFSQ